jgi:hypothetical protein
MKHVLTTKNLLLAGLAIIVVSLGTIMVYLYIAYPTTAHHITTNHLKHYITGLLLALIISFLLRRKLQIEQHLTYIYLPLLIASGWPDIIYFISYIIQHATIIGVLTNKNSVYYAMHTIPLAFTAGPVITAAVMFIDKKNPLPYWYWPLVMLVLTTSLSALHVVLDRCCGF